MCFRILKRQAGGAALAAVLLLVCRGNSFGSPDSALAELETALARNNQAQVAASIQSLLSGDENVSTLLSAGGLLAEHDRLQEAAAVFQKCAQRFPASFEAKYNLALARIGLDEQDRAQAALNSITPKSAQEAAAVQYLQGKVYTATGRANDARHAFEKAYYGNPGQENYALDLALAYLRASGYVQAIQVLEPSLQRHPGSPELMLELALSYSLGGRQADAVALCRKLAQKDPHQPTVRLIQAFADCTRGDFHLCEADAAAGLESPHHDPYLDYFYANALWSSGAADHAKMLGHLNAAIRTMPTCSSCLMLRSKVLEASHDDRGAIADLKNALAQDPKQKAAWYRLSVLYRKTGQREEALEALNHYHTSFEQEINGEVENFRKHLLGNSSKP